MKPASFAPLARTAAREARAFLRLDDQHLDVCPQGPGAARPPTSHRVVAARRAGRVPADRPAHRLAVRAIRPRPRGGPGGGHTAAGCRGLPPDRRPAQSAPSVLDGRGAHDPSRGSGDPAPGAGPRTAGQTGLLFVGVSGRDDLGSAGRPFASGSSAASSGSRDSSTFRCARSSTCCSLSSSTPSSSRWGLRPSRTFSTRPTTGSPT